MKVAHDLRKKIEKMKERIQLQKAKREMETHEKMTIDELKQIKKNLSNRDKHDPNSFFESMMGSLKKLHTEKIYTNEEQKPKQPKLPVKNY
mmetsp:Transcript_15595/g.13321  ORF Transcript_15595/g.13321 Transcript_15595/m.13321 type:complete len:91 (-) Transcript_15595:243-515(-)|eukprot:CAMPEP_0114594216 /NCGR_PEP_ID=MMETSP0125-20121206/15832_1 /TAXON_ID=485358 ORGANISM="Aristerostoma sp., Strain ATCC 50986" /NCGR_SAMPLE_ID=MMETSP0125 /ASSEMBLY_ACC=CAM_ASM_000245 /LENGTH=90 /DNA_ID=CAMNT_0001794217 /DNA_START=614 /DNA_END=886 /DNA_ORIENTATION=-